MQGYWPNLINFPPSNISIDIKCLIALFYENILSQKKITETY
jgi:hypothetical protein